jgi:hypothetical protein
MGRYYTGDIEGKLWFGVQSSDDADFFGVESEYVYSQDEEPDTTEEPTELSYSFTKEDLEGVEEGLDTCREKLGSYLYKLDDFFRRENGYSKDQLARELGVTKDEAMGLLKWYARYELGKKIRWSIQANGQCNFTCEL